MSILTKPLNPAFGHLRILGFLSVNYVDGSNLQGEDHMGYSENINAKTNICMSLWYTIHHGKSILKPIKVMELLGFILDSREMSAAITLKKKVKISASRIAVLENPF